LGYGSAGTPPWVDEKRVEEDKQKQKDSENLARIKALEKENEALKKRVAELEAELKKKRK
jgi:cell division protein FtsB